MESRHLFTFLVVVETGGFTKAAQKMDYAQSSVTAQIQALEAEIGQPLFDRIGRSIRLTDAGERLLPFAQEIQKMHLLAEGALNSGSGIGGTLTIGAPESLAAFRLPAVIRDYKKRYPGVKIVLRPGPCWELLASARSGELDLAFLLQPETADREMEIETLIREEMALIAPPDHPLASGGRVDAASLRGETILSTESGCSYRALFEQRLNRFGVFPDPMLEFWSLEAIKQCVAAGLGLAFLPRVAVRKECEDGRLARLDWDDTDQRVSTQVAYHGKKWRSPALLEFLRIVREHARRWNAEDRIPAGRRE
ncbi:LysR family transcriptional regulator [Saccharibacillus sp. CPCC 101409]|uniref:LysR family transcriptional regulator n=1 Tax=Saccharibacillus sp. CPCC 101409 TaxID=3058041 RepID=UPI002670E4AF|nr:LysR family transcriptional regulator [Saccharibacillus sp. CPCC 101409]MDO3408315.1 LysR family transcriptional regulator [Saccharibacillus sp. CPCC 101409]